MQFGLGAALTAAMVIVGLRLALGDEPNPRRGFALLVGSLAAGLIGLLLIALATLD